MSQFHLKESSNKIPRVKNTPKTASIPVPFSYFPSDDGTDENLLILLHGLGDTHVPFAGLGRQLKLPQTAILALRGSEQIPYLYEDAYQWYESFDPLGELLTAPNPTPALELLTKVVDHLTKDLHWPLNRLHFFGFAQGGSVAAEFCIKRWKDQLQAHRNSGAPSEGSTSESPSTSFGSVVTVSGPLLSYPTITTPSPTPTLVVHRPAPSEEALPASAIRSSQRGFQNVTEAKLSATHSGMPRSKDEWEPIMRFWSSNLSRRQMEGLYEVMSGLSG